MNRTKVDSGGACWEACDMEVGYNAGICKVAENFPVFRGLAD